MAFPAKEMIRARKSVRSFDGRSITPSDRASLEAFIERVTNPFGVPVTFRLLEAKAHELSSPVIVGADLYLAAKAPRQRHFEIACGYSFEYACLYARSLGIGTVMLAASLSRATFERAMDVQADEVMPVASPVGYPAARRTIRDALMRKGLKADDRVPFERLFFDGTFGSGMKRDAAGAYADALEMARWAPSAANRQPWRAVVAGDTVHFYEERSMKDSALGDIQKVDMGIALAHFDLTLLEAGVEGRFFEADPGLTCPENTQYVISYRNIEG